MIHMAMVKDVMFGKTMRKSYAKYEEILEIPNMLKIQKDSYQWFLDTGLREVFKDVGTITDFSGKLELSFLDYTMEDKAKYTIEECKERDATYSKALLRGSRRSSGRAPVPYRCPLPSGSWIYLPYKKLL